MKDKLAEEIKNILSQIIMGEDADGNPYHFGQDGSEMNQAIKLLSPLFEAYHEAANKQITEDDFEAWASEQDFGYGANYYLMKAGAKMGVRALKDGEIKHIEP